MRLIDQIAARKAAFYFVERDGAAYAGNRELMALIARSLAPGKPFTAPAIHPVWGGSYLPFEEAYRRWAFPDVWVLVVGCADAEQRRRLVERVRAEPPLGMFDLDADADDHSLPLVLLGFALPNAVILRSVDGRMIDHETGLDMIGISEEEDFAFTFDFEDSDGSEDVLQGAFLRLLANSAGRRVVGARPSDGFEALIDHAFEIYTLGATGAAGSVASVAFEQLMRAALTGDDRDWAEQLEASQEPVKLNDVIGKVASANGCDDGRLRKYQRLRNDLAHRLGDTDGAARNDNDLNEAVREFLHWLERQGINEHGEAVLVAPAPEPEITYEALLAGARTKGDQAAAAARTTPMQIGHETIEPIGFAWVIVRDLDRPFTRWLLDTGEATLADGGARLRAPGDALERNLAWAHAVAKHLRSAGQTADYGGRPD